MGAQHKYLLFFLLCIMLAAACQPDGDSQQNGEETQSHNTDQQPAPKTNSSGKTLAGITEDYENTNRVIWQKPEVVLNLLGDLTNKTVADIGAGTGFFSLRMAKRAEKVIAIDIDPRFTDQIDSLKILELPEDKQDRLETRLANADDPGLKENEVDIIMIVNTFIYIPNKLEYLKTLRRAIAPGGKLLIIDFKKKRTPLGPPSAIRLPLYEVENLLIEAGFSEVTTNDTVLDYQYIVIATD